MNNRMCATLGLLIVCALVVGFTFCSNMRERSIAPPASIEDIAQWRAAYTMQARLVTVRFEDCTTEILSLQYSPAASGPVCQQACLEFDAVNKWVDTAPSYIVNAKQYRLNDAHDFCANVAARRAHKVTK